MSAWKARKWLICRDGYKKGEDMKDVIDVF